MAASGPFLAACASCCARVTDPEAERCPRCGSRRLAVMSGRRPVRRAGDRAAPLPSASAAAPGPARRPRRTAPAAPPRDPRPAPEPPPAAAPPARREVEPEPEPRDPELAAALRGLPVAAILYGMISELRRERPEAVEEAEIGGRAALSAPLDALLERFA